MEDDGHRNPQGKPEKGEPARGTHIMHMPVAYIACTQWVIDSTAQCVYSFNFTLYGYFSIVLSYLGLYVCVYVYPLYACMAGILSQTCTPRLNRHALRQ